MRVKFISHGQEYAYNIHHYLSHHFEKGSLVIHYGHKKVSLWELEIRKIKCLKDNQGKSMSNGGKYYNLNNHHIFCINVSSSHILDQIIQMMEKLVIMKKGGNI